MNKKLTTIVLVLLIVLMANSLTFAQSGVNEALYRFQQTINAYGNVLIAFALATSVLVFIIHFIRLANSYDHPYMRRQVQRDIFITGITVAMIGGIGVIGKIVAATVLHTP